MQHTPERATRVDPEQFDNLTKRVDRLCARVDQLRIDLSALAGEFRVVKWFMGFALVAIMGGLGFLHQGQADLREAMHRGRRHPPAKGSHATAGTHGVDRRCPPCGAD